MFSQAIAVFLVLGLLLVMLWWLRRKGAARLNLAVASRRNRQKLMQVVERVPLTANHSLHLVRIQDRVLLIGVSPSGCSQLESFSQTAFSSAGMGDVA